MRFLVLLTVLLASCTQARGPVDRVGPDVAVTVAPAPAVAPLPPNGLPFHLSLF